MEDTYSGRKLTSGLGNLMQTGLVDNGLAWRSTNSGTFTAQTGVLRLDDVELKADTAYMVALNNINLGSTVATDDLITAVRYSTSGVAGVASTNLGYVRNKPGSTTQTDKRPYIGFLVPPADATYSFIVTGWRVSGTGNASFYCLDEPLTLMIIKLGASPGNNGIVL